ncbi:MAG: cation:proton antiporter [Bacteroidetes bacterium]|nr:cation:proton antiporter [Bacteroidota bacterium]
MQILYAIIFLGLLIFLSHLFNGLFDKTKIPNVLLLLLIGIIVGPIGGWVSIDFFGSFGSVFTTITLIVILFESGANLKFSEIKVAIGSALVLTIVNFVFTIVIATLVVNLFTSLDMLSSIFIGSIIGGTSSAVVIPMVKQLKLANKSQTVLFLESALSDVLCLVVGLAVLEGMRLGAIDIGGVFSKMGMSFLFAALLGLVAGIVWSILLNLIRGLHNSMFTTLAFVFILYGIIELLNFNGGISVLTFGILVGNSSFLSKIKGFRKVFAIDPGTFNDNEKSFFGEIVFVLQTYFFVYIGIAIRFDNIGYYLLGLLIVTAIILVRPFGIKLVTRKNTTVRDTAIMSVMTPKGLITAVMSSLPLQMGLTGGDTISSLGYSIVLFSILICSVLVIVLSKDPLIFLKVYGGKNNEPEKNPDADVLVQQTEDMQEVQADKGEIAPSDRSPDLLSRNADNQ